MTLGPVPQIAPEPPKPPRSIEPGVHEGAGAYNWLWPHGSRSESPKWGRFWIIACLVLAVGLTALFAYMARGRWPSKELLERCSDPSYHGGECGDVEGRSSKGR
ncbi:MAG TPA: hypothetical protein VHE30_16825, partial [Polyangiaceae bacterium]|nr:hypothetical protein [Polyangiaceae bacterium]